MDLSVVFTFVPFSLPEPSAEGFRLKTPTLGRVLAMAVMAPGQFTGVPEGNPFPMDRAGHSTLWQQG